MATTNKMTIVLGLAALACDPSGGAHDGSAGAEALACEPATGANLDLVMQPGPPEQGSETFEIHQACTVASVSNTPTTLGLSCGEQQPTEFVLSMGGLAGVDLAAVFEVGAAVELDYATIFGVFQSPAWAAVRLEGQTAPSLVAVRSWQPLPWFSAETGFMSPLVLEFRGDTDCADSPGSCNEGSRRRGAVELTTEVDEPSVVFDRNDAAVGGYRVVVGHAEVDEGNCEGIGETWYEVVVIRATR